MKNIILITFTLVLGVVGAWAQTALPNASATLVSGTIYTATTKTINGTLTVPRNGTVTIYIPAGITLTINGEDGTNSTGISISHPTGTVGQPGKPAINVPDGSTLIITGYGTLKAKGGRGGNGSSGTTGNGGSGAAPAIGGIGGVGGKGWTSSDDKNGKDGESMGNVYILDQVSIEAQKGAQGERHEYIFTGGEGGKAPNFSIGGGGAGGRSTNGTDGNNGNNGNLYIQNTATVSYKDSQGNTDTSRPDVNVVPPTKNSYTFYGYNIGSTWVFDANGSIKDGVTSYSGSISEYWVANEYTVALDLQGGTGGTSSVTATYDSAMPSATAPTRTGYTFHGYFTEANGEGTKYYNADMSSAHIWDKANNTTTLYAHWTANSYTVTLDANGGTGGTTSVSATYDSAMPSATAPTRTGYTFTGYYYNDTQYYDGSMTSTHTWDRASATTLQAHWTINNYTLTYDVNGGNALSPDHKSVTYNTAYGELPTPTRTGYTFVGWYTQATGGTAVSSSTIMGAGDVTIHAHWTANIYTVQFDKQSGSGGTASVNATYDSAMPPATAPTRAGYTFAGYYTSPNGGGTQYYDENMVSVSYWNITTNPSTLYANWTANTYTLNFDVQNGDALSPSTQSVTYDAAYGTLPTPTRYGFAFKGWYTTPNGGSETDTEVLTSDIYSIDGDQTIYAHWNTIVVDIDAYSAETQLTGNYFRTFYDSQIAHILPTGVKAYKGKIEGNNLVLTAIEAKDDDNNDIIPKNVPVILRMMPNEEAGVPIPGDLYQIKTKQISLTTSESELTIDNTDNELIGSDIVIATAVANSYILSFGSNGLGFYEWSTHPLEAHKAYVIKDSANPAKALTFRFEDDVTGINETIKDFMFNDSNMAIYNLNGIRLSKPQKGLNIINGRKVWVK